MSSDYDVVMVLAGSYHILAKRAEWLVSIATPEQTFAKVGRKNIWTENSEKSGSLLKSIFSTRDFDKLPLSASEFEVGLQALQDKVSRNRDALPTLKAVEKLMAAGESHLPPGIAGRALEEMQDMVALQTIEQARRALQEEPWNLPPQTTSEDR